MKRFQAPNSKVMVTGLVILALMILVGPFAFGRDVKITIPADLVNCAAGVAVAAGSDAGYTPVAGDKCVLDPITYNVGPVIVTLANLTITSRSGAVTTNIVVPVDIQIDGVTIDDVTVSAPGFAGILISTNATRNITVRNCSINNNTVGIGVITPSPVRDFKFLSNEFRGNGVGGIGFAGTVVGISGLTIHDGVFSGNGEAIFFDNSLGVSDVSISGNQILSSAANGIRFGATVTDIKDTEISRNIIEGNVDDGIDFDNNGDVDSVAIEGNKSSNRGINGNGDDGIDFDNGGSVSETTINNNNIAQNANDGIEATPGGDIEDYILEGNQITNNRAFGAIHVPGGDFEKASINHNIIRNNAAAGFIAVAIGNAETVAFQGNQVSENLIYGVFVGSVTSDVSNVSFSGDRVEKNGLQVGVAFNLSGIELVSFSHIKTVIFDDVTAIQNGGSGIGLNANGGDAFGIVPVNAGDIDGVSITNCHLDMNGSSAPAGQGAGIYATGTVVRNVTMSNSEATSNDDHGLAIASNDDMISVSAAQNAFDSNDRNNDGIGAGVMFDSKQDMEKVSIKNNASSGSRRGIHLDIKGANGRDITIEANTASNNAEEGILIAASDDLDSTKILNNTLIGNNFAISINVTDRGSGVEVKNNTVHGRSGTGIVLNSTGVTITGNEIRNNDVGIDADKATDNHVNQNNIVGNRQWGVDASGLGPGEILDAKNNWWGQPSGPGGAGPGLGDPVTSKVDFSNWLTAPAVVTGANFQVTTFDAPSQVDVGTEVTITATITNTGAEEGEQDIILRVKDPGGNVVQSTTKTILLTPAGSSTITLKYSFSTAGTFTVEAVTDNDSQTKTIAVGGAPTPGQTVEGTVAGHTGSPNIIEDADILWAIQLWITQTPIPEAGGAVIDDAKILELIGLWIGGTPVSAASLVASAREFAVEQITFSPNPIVSTNTADFVVEGVGIAGMRLEVFNLAGQTVFAEEVAGNSLEFHAMMNSQGGALLANGVYLYIVTVHGFNGEVVQSEVRKLVILR